MRLASMLRKHASHPSTQPDASIQALRRQWDQLRADATTPSERAEIDAMFSRSMP